MLISFINYHIHFNIYLQTQKQIIMNNIIENRGAKTKYNFKSFKVGEKRTFPKTTTATVLNCAKRYAKVNGLNWAFRCFTERNGKISIVRVR